MIFSGHCEERSDEAIQLDCHTWPFGFAQSAEPLERLHRARHDRAKAPQCSAGRIAGLGCESCWRGPSRTRRESDRRKQNYLVLAQPTLGGYEFDLKPFVAMDARTCCKIYFGEEAVLSAQDLKAEEDKLVAAGKIASRIRDRLAAERYPKRAVKSRAMGADGVHLFKLARVENEPILAARVPWQTR